MTWVGDISRNRRRNSRRWFYKRRKDRVIKNNITTFNSTFTLDIPHNKPITIREIRKKDCLTSLGIKFLPVSFRYFVVNLTAKWMSGVKTEWRKGDKGVWRYKTSRRMTGNRVDRVSKIAKSINPERLGKTRAGERTTKMIGDSTVCPFSCTV